MRGLTWVLGVGNLPDLFHLVWKDAELKFRSLLLCLLNMRTQKLRVAKESQREGGLRASFQVMQLEFEPVNNLGSQERPCFLGPWCLNPFLFTAERPRGQSPPLCPTHDMLRATDINTTKPED